MRILIDNNMIPDDVTVQVLTQCREHIIRKTIGACKGAPNGIDHFYNSANLPHVYASQIEYRINKINPRFQKSGIFVFIGYCLSFQVCLSFDLFLVC